MPPPIAPFTSMVVVPAIPTLSPSICTVPPLASSEAAVIKLSSLMIAVSDEVIGNEEILSEADRQIGDGDHGLGMKRGFIEVKKQLEGLATNSIREVFTTVGMAQELSRSRETLSGADQRLQRLTGADAAPLRDPHVVPGDRGSPVRRRSFRAALLFAPRRADPVRSLRPGSRLSAS